MNDFDAQAQALDAQDPLAPLAARFAIPKGKIYLDGNSLGGFQSAIQTHLNHVLEQQWREDLIGSWMGAGWFDAPLRVGDQIAPLIGAGQGQIAVGDSTSVNLFKALDALLQTQPQSQNVLLEAKNFATDNYMAQALARLNPAIELDYFDPDADILERIDATGAGVLMLSLVDYKSARIQDMARINRGAAERNCRVLWDLSHATGAVRVDLLAHQADAAVGCTYKYLNGGPGAPAFIWVHPRWIDQVQPALPGWMGAADPFDFNLQYQPEPGIRRMVCGTPQILSLSALEAALQIWQDIDLDAVVAKTQSLTEHFIQWTEALCAEHSLVLKSPRDPRQRGGHVIISHPEGYAVMQALIARGVVGDFRPPSLMRFGFSACYVSHQQCLQAVRELADVLETRAWDQPAFKTRARVT